jgi:uncharacterized LabA/DUF88 family protein
MDFTAKTEKLTQLAQQYPQKITELEEIFQPQTNIYIDWANLIGWQQKLGRHIHDKRLYQFFRSFNTIDKIRWYYGTLEGDTDSQQNVADKTKIGYDVCTKPVKIMHHSIDIASLPTMQSPNILKSFLTKGLISVLPNTSIDIYNQELKKLNDGGTLWIEEKKCNFDVEIGANMILDDERSSQRDFYTTYVLWSGDSDFTDIVQKMISQGKRVYIFSIPQKVSKELSQSGATIFNIQKIKEFICRPREI